MSGFLSNENKIVTLSGSPYEIGYKHGKTTKKKVCQSLQTYEKMFKETLGISWKDASKKALLHVPAIEKYNENYIKEMEGIADGASVTFEDILTLNTRSEIALIDAPDGCTSFALTKPKTNKTWLAQNWDWKGTQIDSLVHLKIEQKELPTLQMITEAGIIGKIGSNNAGIGVCLNALVTNTWEPKVPIHLGLRAILESETFEEAISRVGGDQMASPAHFLIASKTGELASMEVSPIHTAKILSANGTLVHTNHLCSAEMRGIIQEEIASNSYQRLTTMDEMIQLLDEKDIKEEEVFELLSNHKDFPTSICRHFLEETEFKLTEMETVFSIAMNLTDNVLTWLKGKPCEHLSK
ncbi:C45 family peptidase [Lentibacillus sp. N15]|uniref:C45 family peptidase n=1 Tax=Lentibacillus songyuanensis TaxID=3136161 RepID=UPI0031BB89C6